MIFEAFVDLEACIGRSLEGYFIAELGRARRSLSGRGQIYHIDRLEREFKNGYPVKSIRRLP